MATQPSEKQIAENTRQASLQMNALIGEQVMHQLGEPGNLHMVQVRKLWDEHYRVNVVVGADAASVHIADCFFLITDTGGNILESSPKIVKRY
jgi:hypothetical protein